MLARVHVRYKECAHALQRSVNVRQRASLLCTLPAGPHVPPAAQQLGWPHHPRPVHGLVSPCRTHTAPTVSAARSPPAHQVAHHFVSEACSCTDNGQLHCAAFLSAYCAIAEWQLNVSCPLSSVQGVCCLLRHRHLAACSAARGCHEAHHLSGHCHVRPGDERGEASCNRAA